MTHTNPRRACVSYALLARSSSIKCDALRRSCRIRAGDDQRLYCLSAARRREAEGHLMIGARSDRTRADRKGPAAADEAERRTGARDAHHEGLARAGGGNVQVLGFSGIHRRWLAAAAMHQAAQAPTSGAGLAGLGLWRGETQRPGAVLARALAAPGWPDPP